jgi:hypothetical protein
MFVYSRELVLAMITQSFSRSGVTESVQIGHLALSGSRSAAGSLPQNGVLRNFVAKLLGLTVSAVRSRSSRARKFLRKHLERKLMGAGLLASQQKEGMMGHAGSAFAPADWSCYKSTAVDFPCVRWKAMLAVREHSASGSLAYYFMDWRHMTEILSAGQEVYTELLNLCVWAKSNGGMGSFYRSAHELVFLFKNGTGSHRNNVQLGKFGRYRTNVWNYPGANTFPRSESESNLLALHPTPKPVALIVDAVKDCTARGDLVLDPFLGSGTAVIAAERSGRRCYGLELDPLYVDTIIRRWQRQTKLDAVHVETGESFNSRENSQGDNRS